MDDDGDRDGPARDLRAGDVVLVRPGGARPGRRRDRRRRGRARRVDDHRRVAAGREASRAIGRGGHRRTDSSIRVAGRRRRRRDRARRHPAAGREAQASRSRAQVLADRAAALLFYVALGAGVDHVRRLVAARATSDEAVERTVTVLVIACPHALGLAIPLVIALSTAHRGAQRASSSRTASRSSGCAPSTRCCSTRPARSPRASTVVTASPASAATEDEVLAPRRRPSRPTASIRSPARSSPPRRSAGPCRTATEFRSITGRGVEADVDGARVAVGGPALLRERGLDDAARARATADGVDGARRRGALPRARRRASSARSRSRTRSGPSRREAVERAAARRACGSS